MNSRVLVVEDDRYLVEMITWHFEREGFHVQSTGDGERALLMARQHAPDLILLDWMLPGLSGIDLCRRLRGDAATKLLPIVMLSAKAEEQDRVRGLETGADEYVAKPFSPRELIARCKAVLRRTSRAPESRTLTYADLWMDVENYRVRRAGKTLGLGPKEFQLLRHFMENPGRVFSRDRLLSAVWGSEAEVGQRTVDVHIRRLRLILNEGGGAELIRTVRSGGYALDLES